MSLKQVIEALLFASQKPLLPKEIVAALRGATDFSDEEAVVALHPSISSYIEAAVRRPECVRFAFCFAVQNLEIGSCQFLNDPLLSADE